MIGQVLRRGPRSIGSRPVTVARGGGLTLPARITPADAAVARTAVVGGARATCSSDSSDAGGEPAGGGGVAPPAGGHGAGERRTVVRRDHEPRPL